MLCKSFDINFVDSLTPLGIIWAVWTHGDTVWTHTVWIHKVCDHYSVKLKYLRNERPTIYCCNCESAEKNCFHKFGKRIISSLQNVQCTIVSK